MAAATQEVAQTATAKSGIQTSSTGESVIPSSTRADGSIRKEIRVRPGYRPPEDVEVYKNKVAMAWKNRGSKGVPGAEALTNGESSAGQANAASNKNAKRREARKKATAAIKAEPNVSPTSKTAGDGELEIPQPDVTVKESQPTAESEAGREKEARKLGKKLRQARDLKEKREKGDALLPEQFEKVIKINELIRQLDALGFDAEGERKKDT